MDDESKLQIVLEAVNETGSPFQALNESIASFQNAAAELGRSIAESFQEMARSASETSVTIEDNLKGDQEAFQNLATSIGEQARAAESSMSDIGKSAEEMGKAVSESAVTISKDMQGAEAPFKDLEQVTQEAVIAVESSMKAATTAVADFEKDAGTNLRAADTEMNALRDNMAKGVEQIGGLIAIQQLGESMEHLGKQGEHVFDYAIEQGGDFQQTMKNVQTVIAANTDAHESWNQKLQDTASLTDQLQQKALDLGSRGAQSANEVGEAMDAMLRAGVDAKTVLGGAAEEAQNVAIVTGEKMDESANLVTEIFHMFREQFSENGKSIQENMKETGNVLTGTLLSARINSQDFLDTLKYVGPVASQLGSNLDDTAAAAALLAQNGIKGSQAGNNLKRAITNLLEPTKQGAEAMQHLGLIVNGHNLLIDESTGKMKNLTDIQDILHHSMEGLTEAKKAQYMHDIFGQYAMAGTLVLANENSEAFQKLKEHIDSVSASDAAASMLDTFSGHMAQLKAHVATTAKEFGMAFLPVLEKLLPIGNAILNWLQQMTPQTKELLMGMLGVGSVIAIAGGALASFAITAKFAGEGMTALKGLFMVQAEGQAAISVFRAFAVAVREVGLAEAFMDLMNPMGWIALAVAAIVGLAVVITQHWEGLKQFFEKTWNEISSFVKQWGAQLLLLMGPIGMVAFLVIQNWDKIKSTTIEIWQEIKASIKAAWDYISPTIMGAIEKVSSYWHSIWPELKEVFVGVWNVMKVFLAPILVELYIVISGTLGLIKGMWHDVWNAIKDSFKLVWDLIVDILRLAWDWMSGIFKIGLDLLTGHWSDAWTDMKNLLGNVWEDIKKLFGDFVINANNFGKDMVMAIAHGIEGAIGAVISAAQKVVGAIKSIFSSAPTAPTVSASSGSGGSLNAAASHLPHFADGGVVSKPTVALIGEGGEPEYVIPQSKLTRQDGYMVGLPRMEPVTNRRTGGDTYIIVNASNNVAASEQHLAKIVSQHLLGSMKMQGKLG